MEASSAIPSFFAPVEIGGVRYVDGGTHSPTNLDVLADDGLDLVVVSSPMSVARGTPVAGSGWRAVQALRLGREARAVRRSGAEVVAFQPTAGDLAAMGGNSMDAAKRGDTVRAAYGTTLRRLERPSTRARLAPLTTPD